MPNDNLSDSVNNDASPIGIYLEIVEEGMIVEIENRSFDLGKINSIRSEIYSLSIEKKWLDDSLLERFDYFSNLKILSLKDSTINFNSIGQICDLDKLEVLCLENVNITINDISSIDKMPSLITLDVTNCSGWKSGLFKVISSKLNSLYCAGTSLLEKDLVFLPSTLVTLDISRNQLTDHACELLLHLSKLKKLYLDDNFLTDKSQMYLSKMKALKEISLYGNQIKSLSLDPSVKIMRA